MTERESKRVKTSGAAKPDALEPDEVLDRPLSLDELDPFGKSGSARPRSELPVHLSLIPRDMDSDALLAADPLAAYLAHLRYIEPLPAEDQQALAERYHNDSDVQAAKLLILSNVRLVVKIAREYRRRRESLMELIQEGNVGLAEAIRRYDPYRGVKFTSYAQYWIRAMIMNYLMNVGQTLKIGSTRAGRKLFFNLRRERERLLRETNEQPSTRLLAEQLEVSEAEVVNVMRVLDGAPLSLDAPAPGFEKTSLGSVLSDHEASSPEDDVVEADFSNRLNTVLREFGDTITDKREKTIWSERVLSDDPKSLQQLGDMFSVSRERVRQIESKLKKRVEIYLRQRFRDDEIQLIVTD